MNLNSAMYMQSQPVRIASRSIIAAAAVMQMHTTSQVLSQVPTMLDVRCRGCFARFYCSGGCAANSFNFHGSITDAYDIGCEMQKKRIECAIMIKAALADMEEETGASADVAGEISHVC